MTDQENQVLNYIPAGIVNSIKGSEIAGRMDMSLKKGYPQIREIIHSLRVQGFAIGSTPKGYFIIETPEELLITLAHLNNRIKKIREAVDGLYNAVPMFVAQGSLFEEGE